MGKLKITGKALRMLGYPEGPVISIAMHEMHSNFKHFSNEEAVNILENVLTSPEDYISDQKLERLARHLMALKSRAFKAGEVCTLNQQGIYFNIFGAEHIEEGALNQMQQAAKLPVSVAGALMPDAHHGYGLPIGGVLAVENAVIPYGVGVDIGCRMCLSVFDLDPSELSQRENYFTRELNDATLFGAGKQFEKQTSHEVLDRKEFREIEILRPLHSKAASQLGSSGSGNHFVEFGIVEIDEQDDALGLPTGKYLGLLSHSGSRAVGATIANHYTKVAKQKDFCPLKLQTLHGLASMNRKELNTGWR